MIKDGGNSLPHTSPGDTGERQHVASVIGEERPWSTVKASVLCWLIPATTARHTHHLRLRRVFASHVLAALLAVVLWIGMVAWSYSRIFDDVDPWAQCVGLLGEIIVELGRHPLGISAAIVGTVIGVEVGYVIAALTIMSWGAKDEPVRTVFANALRRLWLHSWHVVVAIVLLGPLFLAIETAQMDWWSDFNASLPPHPQWPGNVARNSQAWNDYTEARDEYNRMHSAAWDQQAPLRAWHVKYGDEMMGYICFAAATWILWALFRAIGAPRRTPPIERPPTCEKCGYNLIATPMEGRCPECGDPVVASLGPDVRPGTLWERRHEVGWWHAWWRCSVDVVLRPRKFGRQLKTRSCGTSHRLFLVLHLVPMFLIGAAGVILSYVAAEHRSPLAHEPVVVWAAAPAVGYLGTSCAFLAALSCASWVGIPYLPARERSLMSVALQAACYLAGFLTIWALIAAGTTVMILAQLDWFSGLSRRLLVDDELLVGVTWVLPNLLCLSLFGSQLWRVTEAARWANR